DLEWLADRGPAGRLLAAQAVAWSKDRQLPALGAAHPGLADDLVLFHWDPLTCAVAAGWDGWEAETVRFTTELRDDVLHFEPDPLGGLTRVVTSVDAAGFTDLWRGCIEAATSAS